MLPAWENGVLPPDEKGIVYYDMDKYQAGFYANPAKEESEFRYTSQEAFYARAFTSSITNAASKSKPTFGIATGDKIIAFDINRNPFKRSNTKVTEIKGMYVVNILQA